MAAELERRKQIRDTSWTKSHRVGVDWMGGLGRGLSGAGDGGTLKEDQVEGEAFSNVRWPWNVQMEMSRHGRP